MPEDRRAAIEAIAIQEIMVENHQTDDLELIDGKLPETKIRERYHWCCTQEMQADILTKQFNATQREKWRSNCDYLKLSPKKTTTTAGPNRKRPSVSKGV